MGLLFGWRGRIGRWPTLARDRSPWGVRQAAPGEVKVVSTQVLERLMVTARRTPGVSATGRPEWIALHRAQFQEHYLVAGWFEGHGFYRCIVLSGLGDDDAGTYTLDVHERDFHRLRDVSASRLVELAHRYVGSVRMLPLDPSQQEAWERASEERRPRRRPGVD